MTDSTQHKQTQDFYSLQGLITSTIPKLSSAAHKGQAGRVGVIGGSRDFTGAPYFASISALKVGADLAYVFCSRDAAPAIKSYSPELIVLPVLDSKDNGLTEIVEFLPKLHSLVIGPGLGRDELVLEMVSRLLPSIKEKKIPVILDADALHLITNRPKLVNGFDNMVMTPNKAEFSRLLHALKIDLTGAEEENDLEIILKCSQTLNGPTLFVKGSRDVITNGQIVVTCNEASSPRRCGGQGDILAGSISTFSCWFNSQTCVIPSNMLACLAASALTRRCNQLAFTKVGRGMLSTDMIKQINRGFRELFTV